ISFAVVIFFVAHGFRNMTKVLKEKRTGDATLQSLRAMEDLMDDMQDIETGEQGYIISGNRQLLSPYSTAVRKLAEDTVTLKALYPLYPERKASFEQLLQLVRQKTELVRNSVDIMAEHNDDSAQRLIESGRSKNLMDSIRSTITSFEKNDRVVLQQSSTERTRAARATARLFVILAAAFVIGLVIVYWKIRSGLKDREKYEQQISYLAGLTEKTSDAIFSTDTQGIIRSWNKGAEDIYGHTKEEAIGKFAPDITRSGKTKAAVDEMHIQILQQGSYDVEVRNQNKKGEHVYCMASVTSLKNEQGEITGYVTMLRNITERKKAEQLLEKFNVELTRLVEEKSILVQSILERITDGFYSVDQHWRFTYMNNTAGEIMGCRPENVIGKNLWEEFPEVVGYNIFTTFKKSFEQQEYCQEEFYYPPFEKWIMVHIYPSVTGLSVFFRDTTEIKKAQEELKHSNDRFEMISRTTNDAVWEWNFETGKLWGNDTHQYLYGLKPGDPVPDEKEWMQRIHPDDRDEMVKKQVAALASGANVFITEYRFNTVTDGYKNIYDRCYIVRDKEGKATRILGSMMDVTDAKKAADALQQSEERYRTMIEQASDAIFIMDKESCYIDVNAAGCAMLGLPIGQVKGMSAAEFLPQGHLPITSLKYKELLSGETILLERTLEKKQGGQVDTEVSFKMLSNGNILAIARDITEKKRAEQAIRTSEETRKLIMNSALDAIVCVDKSGLITVWTPQAEKIFGWTELEALGKKLTETIIPGKYTDAHKSGMNNYLVTGKGVVLNRLTELTAINREGKEFPIEISIIPIRQEGAEFFCAFIRDITERKEAAEKILKEKELSETAINSLPGIFYIFDADRKFLKWNKNFETVSGYSAAELAGISPIAFFVEEERALAQQKVSDIFMNGAAELEAYFLTRSGQKIPYFFTGRAIHYEGKPCMLGTGIDIVELRRTQQNYATLVNTVDGIVWEADAKTFQFSFVSRQAERLLGYPVESWTSDPSFWADHIHPGDRDWAMQYFISSTQKKKAHEFEYRMIAADGRVVWLRDIVSVIVENDMPVQLRGIMVDITEQKKADGEIFESNARFQTISKATSDIVWDWNVVDDTIWWNDNYYSLLGIKKVKETTPISDWYHGIHPDDLNRVKEDVEAGIRENKTFYSHEYRFAKTDGSYLHFLDRTFIMRHQDGNPYRMIGSMVNMTPIYEAQQVVAESENRLRTDH
ncbi:MAG: PAS domain S-box protein, partial [Bacteroidota bacterium]